MSAKYVVEHFKDANRGGTGTMTFAIPEEIDRKVAQMKLQSWGYNIDTLTSEQAKYLGL